MTDQTPTSPTGLKPIMKVVLKPAEDFAPRTRKSTSDSLTALKPSLDAVREQTPGVFTIAEGMEPNKAASLVSLLNERHDLNWTFGARSTDDGSAIVQAKYDPANQRKVRKLNRKPAAPAPSKPGKR
jgi:hypothetical protein